MLFSCCDHEYDINMVMYSPRLRQHPRAGGARDHLGEESGAAAARVAQYGHAAAARRIADAAWASEIHSTLLD